MIRAVYLNFYPCLKFGAKFLFSVVWRICQPNFVYETKSLPVTEQIEPYNAKYNAYTLLMLVSANSRIEEVKNICKSSEDLTRVVNTKEGRNDCTARALAAQSGHLSIVESVLASKMRIRVPAMMPAAYHFTWLQAI